MNIDFISEITSKQLQKLPIDKNIIKLRTGKEI